jgi:hypothetical protein
LFAPENEKAIGNAPVRATFGTPPQGAPPYPSPPIDQFLTQFGFLCRQREMKRITAGLFPKK